MLDLDLTAPSSVNLRVPDCELTMYWGILFLLRAVSIGPFCTIGAGVRLGSGCQLHPGSHLFDDTKLGLNCILLVDKNSQKFKINDSEYKIWENNI